MALKWPGGLITKTKVTPGGPTEDGAASGVWTLTEALQWTGKGLWPTAGTTVPEIIFIGGVTTVDASGVQILTISKVNASTTGDTFVAPQTALVELPQPAGPVRSATDKSAQSSASPVVEAFTFEIVKI